MAKESVVSNKHKLLGLRQLAIDYLTCPSNDLLEAIATRITSIQTELRLAQVKREKIACEKRGLQPPPSQNGANVARALRAELEKNDLPRRIFLEEQRLFFFSKSENEEFLVYEAEFQIWKLIKFEHNAISSISQFQIEENPRTFIDFVLSEFQ